MSRIQATFERLQSQGKKALIPYITAGDPLADITLDVMFALVHNGADIIELGVPFSDPMADGPVIQRASERALANGMNLDKVLSIVHAFRQKDTQTPVVLMGYANPIEHYDQLRGESQFAKVAQGAGVDGVLVVDYSPEESHQFAKTLKSYLIDQIFLLAPTSTMERINRVAQLANGYVYYVSLKGVTGAATLNTQLVSEALPKLRKHIKLPICVGFGIRDGQTAKAIAQVSDGVVVGSRLIELMEKQTGQDAVHCAGNFIQDLRQAIDAN